MGLEVAPVRPIARLVVGALSGSQPQRTGRMGPYVPPLVGTEVVGDPTAAGRSGGSGDAAHCELLLRAMLTGGHVDDLERWVAPGVLVWSPVHFSSTRDELFARLHDPAADGDTLSEVVIETIGVDVVLPRVYLEWRLTARFSHPCFIDDDLLVEPTGRLVEMAGVLVSTTENGVITAAHCYYDDFALLEQLVIAV